MKNHMFVAMSIYHDLNKNKSPMMKSAKVTNFESECEMDNFEGCGMN